MANFYDDNDDLRWYFERGLDWDPIVRLAEWNLKAEDAPASVEEAVETYRDFATLIGTFVAEEIAPHVEELDAQPPKLVDGEVIPGERMATIFDRMAELDLHWLSIPREFGGMNGPLLLYMAVLELLARGDQSVMTHYGFHGSMAIAMLIFSIREGTTKFDPERGCIESTRFSDFMEEIGSGGTGPGGWMMWMSQPRIGSRCLAAGIMSLPSHIPPRTAAGHGSGLCLGEVVYVLSADQKLYGLSLYNGQVLWITDLPKFENEEKHI